jgi:hypothetical protein
MEPNIPTPPQTIQFAKDGEYEEAWIIHLYDKKPTDKEMKNYVADKDFKKLIVEYIWNPDNDAQRYVLTVIKNENMKINDDLIFVQGCFNLFYDKLDFESLIKRFNSEIIGTNSLFKTPVELVRLGVFNHWFSVGPIDLWNKGEELNKNTLINKIENRPEVGKSKLNYQGLAFIYNFHNQNSGPYHILKTPCCKKIKDEWVVDKDIIFDYIKSFANPKKQHED